MGSTQIFHGLILMGVAPTPFATKKGTSDSRKVLGDRLLCLLKNWAEEV